MDIVERLAQQAAETINGGEFYDGKWYTEGQRQAWRNAVTPYADEIERLREALRKVDVSNADNEIERLRFALKHCANAMSETAIWLSALDHARKALGEKE